MHKKSVRLLMLCFLPFTMPLGILCSALLLGTAGLNLSWITVILVAIPFAVFFAWLAAHDYKALKNNPYYGSALD